jgi:negative regulator of sigma E activity
MTLHSDHHNPLRTQAHLPSSDLADSNLGFLKTVLHTVKSHLPKSSCPEPSFHHHDPYSARFELLSAYLDNELTTEERKLVNRWLTEEPDIQQTYQRLLYLRQAMRSLTLTSLNDSEITDLHRQRWAPHAHNNRLRLVRSNNTLKMAAVCATVMLAVGSITMISRSTSQGWQSAWQVFKSANWREKITLALHKTNPNRPEP